MAAVMTEHDDGPICQKYDMPQAWCAHCRGDTEPTQRVSRREWEAPCRLRLYARYAGRCSDCGEVFRAGDYIGVTSNDEYVCEECA